MTYNFLPYLLITIFSIIIAYILARGHGVESSGSKNLILLTKIIFPCSLFLILTFLYAINFDDFLFDFSQDTLSQWDKQFKIDDNLFHEINIKNGVIGIKHDFAINQVLNLTLYSEKGQCKNKFPGHYINNELNINVVCQNYSDIINNDQINVRIKAKVKENPYEAIPQNPDNLIIYKNFILK